MIKGSRIQSEIKKYDEEFREKKIDYWTYSACLKSTVWQAHRYNYILNSHAVRKFKKKMSREVFLKKKVADWRKKAVRSAGLWSQTLFKGRRKTQHGATWESRTNTDAQLMNKNDFCLWTHQIRLSDHQFRHAATWLLSFILIGQSRLKVQVCSVLMQTEGWRGKKDTLRMFFMDVLRSGVSKARYGTHQGVARHQVVDHERILHNQCHGIL